MKKILLFISFTFSLTSTFSQSETLKFSLNPDTGEIYYSEVVTVEGKSKADLYLSAKIWFVDTFKSPNDVVQLNDKEEGVIIGKGLFKLKKGRVNFSVKLIVREERYKYEIYDLKYETSIGGQFSFDLRQEKPKGIMKSMWTSAWERERNITLNSIPALITTLKKEMSSNKGGLKKDDW